MAEGRLFCSVGLTPMRFANMTWEHRLCSVCPLGFINGGINYLNKKYTIHSCCIQQPSTRNFFFLFVAPAFMRSTASLVGTAFSGIENDARKQRDTVCACRRAVINCCSRSSCVGDDELERSSTGRFEGRVHVLRFGDPLQA